MSRKEMLVQARDSLAVKFKEFINITAKGDYAAFFEGEDEKYYSIRISNIRYDISWSSVICGGKSNVIKMREKIRNHNSYKSSKCMFFVDADFDNNEAIKSFSDIFITPCYSVENLYFSDAVFNKVLSAEFGLKPTLNDPQEYDKAVECYNNLRDKFIDAMLPFNVLIRNIHKLRQDGTIQFKLNLNNISIENLLEFSLDFLKKKYDEKNPHSIFNDLPNNTQIESNDVDGFFNSETKVNRYRGKQNLEFFRDFLVRLKEDSCEKSEEKRKIFRNKKRVKLTLSKQNILSELSQYADTPLSLNTYLRAI